jgi:hypothetical protein
MAERVQVEGVRPGDNLDVAFKIGMNFHPEFGGLELTLEDYQRSTASPNSVCTHLARPV